MISLRGKKALITGASSGIGKAIALAFGKAGADVIIHYHSSEESAQEVVQEIIDFGSQSTCIRADLGNPEEARNLFKKTLYALGGLDILVANAGIQKDAPFIKMSLEDWEEVIRVNLTAQFICAQESVKIFCKNEANPCKGKIIFMNSVHQVIPWAGRVNYASAKGGLKLLMESLAQEVSAEKIRVNAIAPGAIKTDINKESWETPKKEEELKKLIPYQRVGVVEDVAQAALWLASDESDYVVGTTLYVDGGMKLYPEFKEGG